MELALKLARRGLEHVSPNPMVGAVLVRSGRVVGEGYHRRFGGPHAEVEASRSASDPGGADLYVTLEPCGHHGKTPPCAGAIVRSGIRRVFYAVRDENPVTAGKGLRVLRAHGVLLKEGPLGEEAFELNRPFFYWVKTKTPWVILKWAMTLDGKSATAGGESKWITGEKARAYTHRLRRRVDGVLVGTQTALQDDPILTARPSGGRKPLRIVLDRMGILPLHLRLLSEKDSLNLGQRVYVTSARSSRRRRQVLEDRGLQVLVVPTTRDGLDLHSVLKELGARGVCQLLVEGGPRLLGSFLAAGLAHEVAAFVAPRLLGGESARGAVEGPGLPSLLDTPWVRGPGLRRLGRDFLIEGRLVGNDEGR